MCQEVGKITKQWSGLGKEMFTDADNFGINFPMDLDVKVREHCSALTVISNNDSIPLDEGHSAWRPLPRRLHVF